MPSAPRAARFVSNWLISSNTDSTTAKLRSSAMIYILIAVICEDAFGTLSCKVCLKLVDFIKHRLNDCEITLLCHDLHPHRCHLRGRLRHPELQGLSQIG